jgi:hypothetical protein
MEQPFPEEMSRDRHAAGVDTNGSTSHECLADRVAVPEAAEMVRVTQGAIRKRVQRGTIPRDKDSEGRIYVYVNPSDTSPEAGKDRPRDTVTGQSCNEVLEAYKEQVEFLREELERKETLLVFLTQRIPELEVHSESRGPSEKPLEDTDKGNVVPPGQKEASQRPAWWRRFFGFE